DQPNYRLTVGEDPNDPFTAPNFLIQAFYAIRRAKAFTVLLGQGEHCSCIVKACFQCPNCSGRFLTKCCDGLLKQYAGGFWIRSFQNGAYMGIDLVLQFLRCRIHNVAHKVRLASLPSHALELLADRTNKAAMIIGYNKIDTAKAALLEPTEEGCPAFFRLGVTQHHAKHFPMAICIYADSQHDAPIANAS